MKHNLQIRGTADFSQVTREVKNLTKTIEESLTREGAKLFDAESIKFLRNEANNSLAKMSQQLNRAVQEAADLDEKIRAATGEEEKQNDLIRKRLELTKQIKTLRSESRMLEGASAGRLPSSFSGGRDASSIRQIGGRAGTALGQVASSLPRGVGQVAGVATGVASAAATGATTAAAIALGTLAAAAGAAVLSFSRMSAAFEVFSQSVPKLLTGAAFNVGQVSGSARDRAVSLGFGADETLQQRLDLARAFGTRGTAGQQENMLANTQMASRALGVDASQITGMANQLRSVGGTQMAQTGVAQILSRAMSEGMDRSQATHFLSATASTISEINQNGLLANDAIIGAMASLSRDKLSPEMAQRALGSMQSAITGSTGESNAFFQMAMADAGVGAGTLAGAQMGVAQGLFGIDLAQHRRVVSDPQMLEDVRSLGLSGEGGTGTAGRAQGILNRLNMEMGNRENLDLPGRTARTQFLGQMFGTQDLGQAQKIETILTQLARGGPATQEQRKFLEDMSKDPETKWREDSLAALRTIAGSVAQTKAGESFTKFELGAASASTMNALTNTMIKLDQTILRGIQVISGETAQPEPTSLRDRIFGEGGMAGSIKRFFAGSPDSRVQSIQAMSSFVDSPAPLAENIGKGITPMEEMFNNLLNATIEGNAARIKLLEKLPKPEPSPTKVNFRKHGGRW